MIDELKHAVYRLKSAETPSDLFQIFINNLLFDNDICIQSSLIDYDRSALSNKLCKEINNPDSDMLSYFMNEKIYFLDKDIYKGMKTVKGGNYNFEVDYSVMLDTNYATYINRFINKPEKLNNKIKKTLEILIENDVRFDYNIYIIENYFNVFLKADNSFSTERDKTYFYKNLVNLELFKNIDKEKYMKNGSISFNISRTEAYVLADKIYNNILNSPDAVLAFDVYNDIYRTMVLYIIGILKVRFSSNKAAHNKMNDIFEYMNNVIGLYFEREIKFTYEFFDKPNEYKIFDKIHKNMRKDMLVKEVKNIAWDFSIPRIMEKFFKFSLTRYFIPLFLSHDKNLKSTFQAYNVKGVVFNKDKSLFISYSDFNLEDFFKEKKCKINFEDFFSKEAIEIRTNIFKENINNDFKIIKKEMDSLANILKCE